MSAIFGTIYFIPPNYFSKQLSNEIFKPVANPYFPPDFSIPKP